LRTIRLAIISYIVLVSISCLTQQAASQTTVSQITFTTFKPQLPDREIVTRYIKNLIDTYNLLVNESDKPRPDFDIIKSHFSLYHEAGNSFKVIVIEADPSVFKTEPYQTNPIYLIFIRILADQPDVVMDYNDTFRTLFPNMAETIGYLIIQKDLPFTYNGTVVRQDLVLGIDAGISLTGDYMTNAYNAAKAIYRQDQSEVPTVSQTQTVSQTISQTTTIQSGPDIVSEILSNPLSLPVSIVGIIAILFLVVIPAIFGSDIDFFRFVFIKKERDEKLRDFRRSARENKVKKQEKKQ
jgi:hypothetical protein